MATSKKKLTFEERIAALEALAEQMDGGKLPFKFA